MCCSFQMVGVTPSHLWIEVTNYQVVCSSKDEDVWSKICQGCNGVGVDVSDTAAFCTWNLVQVAHWWTVSSMALLILEQKMHHVSGCVLVIPWWDWGSDARTFSLFYQRRMRASLHETKPSSTERGLTMLLIGTKEVWRILDIIWRTSNNEVIQGTYLSITHNFWKASFLFCTLVGKVGDNIKGNLWPGQRFNCERPSRRIISSPNEYYSNSPEGKTACAAARLVCLAGSSQWWLLGSMWSDYRMKE